MKKLFSKLMFLALAAMTFTACEDVPDPYDIPGKGTSVPGEETELEGATGDGTLENPFNAIAATNEAKKLDNQEVSQQGYYIKGKVVSIATDKNGAVLNFDQGTFGNASFYISDDGTRNNQFYCYRVLYLGNKKWTQDAGPVLAVGDDVIVYAKLTMYNTTPETAANEGFVYELNGKSEGGVNPEVLGEPSGDGTMESPFNVAAAIAKCKEIGSTANNDKYYVKGICVEGGTADASFGNASFYIADTKDGARFYCFQVLGTDGKKMPAGYAINVDDEVLVYGPIYNYKNNTPETAGKGAAYIVTINGKSTDGGGAQSDETIGTAEAPITIADALSRISALENGGKSTMKAYVKGKVVKVATSQANFETYGNLNYYISEDGQDVNTIQVYAGDGLNGEKFKSITDIAQGDEVVVFGTLYKYVKNNNTTPEITDSYLTSLVKGNGGGGEQPSGEVKKVTVAEFNAAAVSNDVWYELKGKVTNLKDGDQYGNFDLVDETGSVYVYGLLSEKGGEKKKFQELAAAKGIKEGSVITIVGNRGVFNDKIEVLNAYFVSIEAGGGDTPTPGGDVQSVSVAQFNAAAVSNDVWYQLKGKVTNLKDGDQYGNFDLVDETGSVYVYGLLAEKGGEKKKFQELVAAKGIKEGSVITIIGNRGVFNDKIEVLNAYFVSIEGGGDTPGGGSDNPGGGEVSGNTLTVDFSAQGFENAQDISTVKLSDGTTLTFSAGENKNGPKYYNSGTAIRMYPTNSFTASASKKIASIVLNCSANNAEGNISASQGSVAVSEMTVTISGINNKTTTVTNTHTGTGAASQLRISSMTITYAE